MQNNPSFVSNFKTRIYNVPQQLQRLGTLMPKLSKQPRYEQATEFHNQIDPDAQKKLFYQR